MHALSRNPPFVWLSLANSSVLTGQCAPRGCGHSKCMPAGPSYASSVDGAAAAEGAPSLVRIGHRRALMNADRGPMIRPVRVTQTVALWWFGNPSQRSKVLACVYPVYELCLQLSFRLSCWRPAARPGPMSRLPAFWTESRSVAPTRQPLSYLSSY